MLDCRLFDYQLLALPASVKLVVCNTMVKHKLAASDYNTRRAECEEGCGYSPNNYPRYGRCAM